jgi:hypothetical protein
MPENGCYVNLGRERPSLPAPYSSFSSLPL